MLNVLFLWSVYYDTTVQTFIIGIKKTQINLFVKYVSTTKPTFWKK